MVNKKVLVTGGAGYVGAHTCKMLAEQGYTPIVFDNLSYGHSYAMQWGNYIKGDLTQYDDIHQALIKTQPVGVVHCAAFTYVGESVNKPAEYYQNNVIGTFNLCNAMVANKVNNIVFSSTCATYGNVKTPIIDDVTPQNPINSYGNTKLVAELMLKDFNIAYKLNYIIVRYFNVAGADPMGKIGEDHNPETHLIPLVIEVALGKRENIKIFGTDYNTPDGTCIRDYIHVNDLAHAHCLALEYLFKQQLSNSFNLGTGKGYSVKQIIKAIEFVSGKKIATLNESKRAGDPAILVADATKAQQVLKWQANYTDINSIIATAYNWHSQSTKENIVGNS
ncbi:UDP-glucose 4-epimerase [Candidatus Hepatincola sp. Av]